MKTYHGNVIGNHYMTVDIETTGLNEKSKKNSGILEVYIRVMNSGRVEDEFYKQFYHPKWKRTKDIHQIPFSELEGQTPFTEDEKTKAYILNLFKRCADAKDDMIFMAHYTPFEYKWFRRFLGLKKEKWFKKIRTCDPRKVAKWALPDQESCSLKSLAKRYGIEPPEGKHAFHRADQDTQAMWEIFYKHLLPILDENEMRDYDPDNYKFDFRDKR